jgi:glycosyltransferase involved in cell wall biosynthesis
MNARKASSPNPMRVLFMQSQTYYGADSRIHGLLMRHLDRRQVEVHVALNYGSGHQKSASAAALEEIPHLRVRATHFGASIYGRAGKKVLGDVVKEGLPAFFSLAGLLGYIRKNRIQIIHCTEKPRDAFFGFLLSRSSGAKCLIHLHVKAEDWIDPKVQWAMRNADALVGVSRFVSDSIVEMGFPAEKTHFVHNSLALDGWDPNLDGSHIRQEFGIDPHTPLLLIVSRLFYWKGHSELLQALAVLKKAVPEFKLMIVGDDDPRAHPGRSSYSAELKTQANNLGLADHVIFTGYRSDIPQLMAACDIYCMPSFEEPFGMVFLEAMAMKKPVIALNNGGSREIVDHGFTGLLSLPQDIDQLAANIQTLVEYPGLRKKMGVRGRKKVAEIYTPAKMAANVMKIYQHMLIPERNWDSLEYRKDES